MLSVSWECAELPEHVTAVLGDTRVWNLGLFFKVRLKTMFMLGLKRWA